MKTSKKSCTLIISCLFLLSSCNQNNTADPNPMAPKEIPIGENATSTQTASNKTTLLDNVTNDPFATLKGTWEGTFNPPLGYKVILKCIDHTSGKKKVLLSVMADTWNYHNRSVFWKINDEILTVTMNSDKDFTTIDFSIQNDHQLTATYTQYGTVTQGIFVKTSDTAEDGEYGVGLQENLIDLLKDANDFDRTDSIDVPFTYEMDNPKLIELQTKYDLDQVAGEGTTQTKAIRLLNWVCEKTNHKSFDDIEYTNALDLLENGENSEFNCKNLSIILTEACLSVGIPAKALWLMPKNPNDTDCHVVTMVYLPEEQYWILLDPSLNGYFSDPNGNLLSPWKIREHLVLSEPMILNNDAELDYLSYVNYLAKNLYYFASYQNSTFDFRGRQEETNPWIYLCPKGFDLVEWQIQNLRFNNNTQKNKNSEAWLKAKEDHIRNHPPIYATLESFWQDANISSGQR